MTETDHIPKRVSKGLFSPIEFTFYSPFTFEECLYLIEQNIEAKAGMGIKFKIIVEKNDKDNANLYILKYYNKRMYKYAEIKGTLQVWQATSTLIKGKARVVWTNGKGFYFISSLILGMCILTSIHKIIEDQDYTLLSFVIFLLMLITLTVVVNAKQKSHLLDDLEDAVAIHSVKEKRGKKLK